MTQVRLLLLDPFTQKMGYGKFSGLITQLLREWIARQQELVRQARARGAEQENASTSGQDSA